MRDLRILLLSDGRPGHYHLAEGVAAAIARRRPVRVERLEVRRRRLLPGRTLAWLLKGKSGAAAATVLRLGFGIAPGKLQPADLVLSAGGETLAANVAAARILGVPNIFCGTLRRVAPEALSLVVSSYARHAGLPRHLVTLKPNGIDPDRLGATRPAWDPRTGRAPALAGLLVGGDSGFFHYTPQEWHRLWASWRKAAPGMARAGSCRRHAASRGSKALKRLLSRKVRRARAAARPDQVGMGQRRQTLRR